MFTLQDYMKDKKEKIKDLIKYTNENDFINKEIYLAIIGTHYMTEEFSDEIVVDYLTKSNNYQINACASYNLGYFYETKCRNNIDIKENEIKMINFYNIAMKFNNFQAYNQIGSYFIKETIIPIIKITPKKCLIIAKEKGIIQAFNNLIILYKNNYDKKITIMKNKFELTKKVEDLMIYILELLNNKDYKNYCIFMKELGNNNNYNISAFLKKYPNLIFYECCVCYEEKKCFELQCKHKVCNNCLFDIFVNLDPLCPLCRDTL